MKARTYAFDEVDRPEEVAKALTDLRQETINEIAALETQLEGCARRKPSKKSKKGFVMKNLLMSIAAIAVVGGLLITAASGQYVQSDISYEIASNPESLYRYLRDTIGTVEVFRLTPTSTPTTQLLEGQLYYDTGGQLYIYDGTSAWVAVATASGNTLDGAYNAGSTIDVDSSTITLDNDVGDGTVLLTITQDDTTGDPDAVHITSNADASTAVTLQIESAAGFDIQGTSDTWNVTLAGVANLVGLVTTTGDVTFTGSLYDIVHDASDDQLEFNDSAILGFGTDADISIAFDNSGDDLNILGDDSEIAFGSDGAGIEVIYHFETASNWLRISEQDDQVEFELIDLHLSSDSQIEFENDAAGIDWTIDNATDETLLFYPTQTDGTQSINLGNASNTTDLRIFGETASTVVYDASADIVIHTDYNINLTDADELRFGTGVSGGDGDFKISGSATPLLLIDAVVDGAGEIAIGNDADDLPMKWYSDTTGEWVYFNDDEVEFEDVVLILMDATQLQFGDSADFYIHATDTAATLGTLTTNETSAWNFGASEAGADVKFFGTTAGDSLLWDASEDYLHMIGDKVLFTLAEATAANVFKVDCTGAAGSEIDLIVLETTDGGIMVNADGGSNGDIELNSADDMIFTSAGNLTVTVTGTTTFANTATFTVGAQSTVFDATADNSEETTNLIPAGTRVVNISAVTNDADDFVVLSTGVLGERCTIIATVACELRTLAASGDDINEVISDGAQEYQLTAGDIVECICVSPGSNWTAYSHTILGAAKTIVPD